MMDEQSRPRYQKPMMNSIQKPTVWGVAEPMGRCKSGDTPGSPSEGFCYLGDHPNTTGTCFSGLGAPAMNICKVGLEVSGIY
jgi:hypothetical protein